MTTQASFLSAALCFAAGAAVAAGPQQSEKAMTDPNPLLTESSLQFRYPPFDRIKTEHFAPAFEQGMAEHRKEIAAIAGNPEAPSFENTIVAMERAGSLLSRTSRVFFGLNGSNTNPEMQKLQREMAPKLAAHSDAITLDPVLFARVSALYDKRDSLGLDPESKRLLWRYHKDFVRAGAKLGDADKEKLKAQNAELAALGAAFNQNVLKEVDASAVLVDTRGELAGLSEAQIQAAADAAKAAGQEGKFLLRLTNTTGQPPLASLESRALRERLMKASLARGSRGGEFDNRATASAIAKRRAERALLLGYPNHAAYQLDEQTAGSVAAVNKLLAQLGPPAVANARGEAAAMQKLASGDGSAFELASWDWAYYAEKVRKARYAFDESQLRPYYELDRVLKDGVFFAAGKLYGLRFSRAQGPAGLPGERAGVRRLRQGRIRARALRGRLLRAPQQERRRLGERLRAAVGPARHQARDREPPEHPAAACGRADAAHPRRGADDVPRVRPRAPRHVLGRPLPALRGHQRAAGLRRVPVAGERDVADWPEVLRNYAKHYKTGAPIPQELLDKVTAAQKFNQGFSTTESWPPT